MINWDAIKEPVVLFDGECNLCSRSVQFIIKHDAKKVFRFASLQSSFGKQIKEYFKIDDTQPETILLLKNNDIYKSSTAILHISKELNGTWKIFYAAIIIPKPIRNYIYNIISKNRYKWFGKKEQCWIPSEKAITLFYS
jgi:predicted DCC family thiol-disulfide oxidoreductase YuxK